MKKLRVAAALLTGVFAFCALSPVSAIAQQATSMVVTAQGKGSNPLPEISKNDISVQVNRRPVQVTGWQAYKGDNANLQLVFLFDESARSYLALQIPSIRKFIDGLPPTAEVAIAYMGNGRAIMAQTLTTDHALASKAMRLTNGIPGITGSPYFCLSDLAKHWPSKAQARRVVFMVTNGEDPYYHVGDMQDPYVRTAISDSQKAGLVVYSIYFRNNGFNGGQRGTLFGQSYLLRVAADTGGVAYNQLTSSPVSFDPYLAQFKTSLDNQYRLTFDAPGSGLQSVSIKTKVSGVKLRAASHVNVGSQS